MRVVVRTDASEALGAGHLVRCVTLADGLAEAGAEVLFVARHEHPLLSAGLAGRRHALHCLGLPPDASDEADAQATASAINDPVDWLLVDHYGLGQRWEAALRSQAHRLAVLDDLADRPHDCDLLVDPGYVRRPSDYAGLLPRHAERLLGPRYALLRPPFAARHDSAAVWPQRQRVHLFFGAGQASLRWLALACERLLAAFEVIEVQAVGRADDATMQALQERFASRLAWVPHIEDMAAHMSSCDAAIGGPGSATWERACIGLPSALMATANNQVSILRRLDEARFACYLGPATGLVGEGFIESVTRFLGDAPRLAEYRARGLAAVDGLGVQRIVERMLQDRGRR
jgi:UDP-2,4-diacetamido-2,4,6-trideoxy-beta-L-altropyranose hydrolase